MAEAAAELLRFARTWEDPPGANQRWSGASTLWTHLRPRLRVERAVAVGPHDAATLRALATVADDAVLAVVDGTARGPAQRATAGLSHIRVVEADPSVLADLLAPPTALVSVASAEVLTDAVLGALRAVLADGGAVRLAAGARASTPALAEEQVRFVPRTADGPDPVLAVGRRGPTALLLPPATTTGAGVELVPGPASGELTTSDESVLVLGSAHGHLLPDWVLEATQQAGHDVDPAAWSVRPGRGYPSQKVVVALGGTASPIVVKAGQDPRFDPLLQNEVTGLRALRPVCPPEVVAPVATWSSDGLGVAVAVESAVRGTPFALLGPIERGEARERILGALVALGAASRREVPASVAATALAELVDRHEAANGPAPREVGALRAAVDAVAASAAPFPVVFQHGDPSPFNLLLDERGRLNLVDFERAEPSGMPLWDIWYFLHGSRAVGSGGRLARWRRRRALPLAVQDGPSLGPLHRRATEAIRLDPALVPPLFLLFWTSLALREASRVALPGDGPHARALARCVAAGPERISALLRGG